MTDKGPDKYSTLEAWLVDHTVDKVQCGYTMTSEDTADYWVTLWSYKAKLEHVDIGKLRTIADLQFDWPNLVKLKYGIKDKVEARRKYEKTNARELAELRRLKEKYGE